MSKHALGILGTVKNSIGNVVFATRDGVTVGRSKPQSYRDAKSQAQMDNRIRMKLAQIVYKHIYSVLGKSFEITKPLQTAYSELQRANKVSYVFSGTYNKLSASEQVDFGCTVNYPNLRISGGSLSKPLFDTLSTQDPANIVVSHTEENPPLIDSDTYNYSFVYINAMSHQVYIRQAAYSTAQLQYTIDKIPVTHNGIMHVYAFRVNASHTKFSPSKYIGAYTA